MNNRKSARQGKDCKKIMGAAKSLNTGYTDLAIDTECKQTSQKVCQQNFSLLFLMQLQQQEERTASRDDQAD